MTNTEFAARTRALLTDERESYEVPFYGLLGRIKSVARHLELAGERESTELELPLEDVDRIALLEMLADDRAEVIRVTWENA